MKTNRISEYLDYLFPNPECELNYSSDYELLIAVVLSAQSTDKRVNSVTPIIFDKYKSLNDLKNADLSDLEHIIHPVGSQHKKAFYVREIAKMLVDDYDGVVPKDRDILIKFPGVGRKTINVFLSEYYKIPAFAVDTHVERISKRLALASKNDNVLEIENKLMKKFKSSDWGKTHLQMVLFGRYYCKAVKPLCSTCQLIDICKEKKKSI